ncbi:uncharacterized protein LOC135137807 isoform X2 [Zophobas morio]|uniref:uncharacterized protein LOC135137807 isoform X2 n=1 Tax=Zophobas morio TaxID=2755281 RepID=UPI003083B8E0
MTILKGSKLVLALTITLPLSSFGFPVQEENGIIRLVNKTRIYCVDEKNVDSAMFTNPPLEKVGQGKNLVESEIWENDDWIIKDSNHLISRITDKRWEDFNSTKTDYTAFNDVMTSVAFSVYQAKEIELFAHDGEAMDYFHKELKNIEGWTTFSIFFKNNHIHYIMDNDLIRRYLIKPTFVGVKTKNETYFKIHSYKYKEATNVTNTKNGPTSLKIPTIKVEYGGDRTNITSTIKETDDFEKWEIYKISLNSSIANEVNLIRTKTSQTEDGYWRLDARLHDNEYNVAAYNINSSINPVEIECKYLQPSDIAKENRPKRNVDSSKFSIDTNCPLGMVGANCDISCAKVLGQQYPHCQGHQICDSTNCGCVKCYTGYWCDEKVDDGNQCPEHNKDYPENTKEGSSRSWMFWPNIFLWTVVLSVIIIEGGRRTTGRCTRPQVRLSRVSAVTQCGESEHNITLLRRESNASARM